MGVSVRNTAFSCRCSTATVRAVTTRAKAHCLEWPLPEEMNDAAIRAVIYPAKERSDMSKAEIDHPRIDKEMNRPGMTMLTLWREYCEDALASGMEPYLYSAFCQKHRAWAAANKVSMRIERKPAQEMQVDYVGDTMEVLDADTGEARKVYVFVACLPYSGEMFADVRRDEDRPFIVSADRLEVKVLGTQFNLKSYQEDAKSEVSLVRGKVSVGIKASKMNGKLTLAPGDILRFNKTNNHIDFLNFDPDSYANWIDNDNFFFVEQTLGDIVADLRRHFAVEIVVTDKSLCDETYYASFVNEESLDEILDALNKDRLFSVRREAEVYYISPPLK